MNAGAQQGRAVTPIWLWSLAILLGPLPLMLILIGFVVITPYYDYFYCMNADEALRANLIAQRL